MRFVLFYHSLISDWNHGNAHFLRGVAGELIARGHEVRVFEPLDGWSLRNLTTECGTAAISRFERAFPSLRTNFYELESLDLDRVLEGADVVIVHEWNEQELLRRIGLHRVHHNYLLLFHDTHHRGITDAGEIQKYEFEYCDGVLAFGEVLRDVYIRRGWARRVWTWHEAADTTLFYPRIVDSFAGDLVWIGNWGDEERTAELRSYFMRPVHELTLCANVYGVRYPDTAIEELNSAGIQYLGWIPNHVVPDVLCRHRATVHIPRRPYVEALTGIPTIRVFEALACGVPLVCSPWNDAEQLFHPGEDFLMAQSPQEMKIHLRNLINDPEMATEIGQSGRATVLARHTCKHRVDELINICNEISGGVECGLLSSDRA